jgi:hypothetical protein
MLKVSNLMQNSNRGRKTDELLARLTIKGTGDDGKKWWGCAAPKCTHCNNGNIQCDRILKHTVKCKELQEYDHQAFNDAVTASRDGSLGGQLFQSASESAGQQEVASSTSHLALTPLLFSGSQTKLNQHVTADGKLNIIPLWNAGQKMKAEANKKFQAEVNHIIMRLICVRGLVPNIVDCR